MLDEISLDVLTTVIGGAARTNWESVRSQAAAHCPQTAARFTQAPRNRAQAQQMANSCIAEMPAWKQTFARPRMQEALDQAFPR